MKKKKIEALPPIKPKKAGKIVTVQELDDEVIVLNVWENKILIGRHALNTNTYEYSQWWEKLKEWNQKKFAFLLGQSAPYWYCYSTDKEIKFNTKEEEKLALDRLQKVSEWKTNVWDLIDAAETDFNSLKRDNRENNRRKKVNETMAKVPEIPEDLEQWILEQATGNVHYALYDKEEKKWTCTSCRRKYEDGHFKRVDGEKKIRHNDIVICPICKTNIQIKKRNKCIEMFPHITLLQPIDDEISVARHFDVDIYWGTDGRTVAISESVRLTLFKGQEITKKKLVCDIYYNQYGKSPIFHGSGGWRQGSSFDNKSNPAHREIYAGYLYPTGIEECLKNTVYENWRRLFTQMAAVGKMLQYNRLMATRDDMNFIGMVEYLFKGRFNKLLYEASQDVSYWSASYSGPLKIYGTCIEEIFDIGDKQKINRIREMDGGKKMLEWMRWSNESGEKIPQETLEWLIKNNVSKGDVTFIENSMSVTKIMNYVKKQQAEGYKGKSVKEVLSQWGDYLRMCERLNKHMDDELVYRPRELKRRHNEAVAEIELRNAEVKADELAKRFPGAEDILKEIKEKYEYSGEYYFIMVPQRLVEIVAEGRALHHCAGSSDRYFDRIISRETYICFLRKVEEKELPYYTIEVEPGGTIRQHRGYLDEEPGIEDIKPFLKEWQREIKKRLNKNDHEYAEVSRVKRIENIEELRAKNNTRVLEGLMEDFMEAM